MARKLAKSHGLDDNDVIVDRESLEELQGLLYCLQAAVEDVERDLAASSTAQDVSEALAWLMENAEPLAAGRLEPRMAKLV
jgi:post-segregation antitoxin (ccd killing protein)